MGVTHRQWGEGTSGTLGASEYPREGIRHVVSGDQDSVVRLPGRGTMREGLVGLPSRGAGREGPGMRLPSRTL